jgi:hypothetical protein
MRSARKSTFVTVFALFLTLAAAGTARAQFGVPGLAGQPAIGPFGPAYGGVFAYGLSPLDYGSIGCVGCGGYGVVNPAIGSAYGWGGIPSAQTAHSYQSTSDAISSVPGWDGPSRRARRRH